MHHLPEARSGPKDHFLASRSEEKASLIRINMHVCY